MLNPHLPPLTNNDLETLVRNLEIKNFRGVFMRDTLPTKVYNVESGIVNLDLENNSGTHWVCYFKNENSCYYFDSFGLDPPHEITQYLNTKLMSSTFQIQKYNTHHCGYYCLIVLKLLDNERSYSDVIINLI